MNKTTSINLNHGKLLLNGIVLSCIVLFFATLSTPSVTMATKAEILEEIQKSLTGEGPSDPIDSVVIGQPKRGGNVGIGTNKPSRAGSGKDANLSKRGGNRSSGRRAGRQR